MAISGFGKEVFEKRSTIYGIEGKSGLPESKCKAQTRGCPREHGAEEKAPSNHFSANQAQMCCGARSLFARRRLHALLAGPPVLVAVGAVVELVVDAARNPGYVMGGLEELAPLLVGFAVEEVMDVIVVAVVPDEDDDDEDAVEFVVEPVELPKKEPSMWSGWYEAV